MRIKRFIAPDMRTALRMVRDEQGPDAVILSNRATADGIEVVAATDYDESLVSQALRAAVPELAPAIPAVVVNQGAKAPISAPTATPDVVATPDTDEAKPPPPPAVVAATAKHAPILASASRELPRESLISRARAIFRMGDAPTDASPTLAELTASPQPQPEAAPVAKAMDAGSRFEEMIAALDPRAGEVPRAGARVDEAQPANAGIDEHAAESIEAAPAIAASPQTAAAESDADYLISLASGTAPVAAPAIAAAPRKTTDRASSMLHAVATDAADTDPAMLAMRRELATMRELMERQMEQLSLERLRGSPARAAAFEALLGLGCDNRIAQTVAAGLDPRIAPSDIRQPMLDALIRTLAIAHSEPIEDGGVIALVGPTGAGKTTTAAKLAARYAARHRARDVAMVSIDRERTGAREQLHALGRRLGVTVCDAENSDGLERALEQLADYPLVLVDTAGYGVRDRALLRQILWLRASSRVRSLLVLPANAHPHDLTEIARRYRPTAPQGVVLTKLDESGRLGAALSVLAQQQLPLAYTCSGQLVPDDVEPASADSLADILGRQALEPRATENPALEASSGAVPNLLALEDRHAFA